MGTLKINGAISATANSNIGSLNFTTSGSISTVLNTTSEWARGWSYKINNIGVGGFGMFGSAETVKHFYFGAYDDAWCKIEPDGTVTATKFKGALSGNASTASKWATARTLTLSGDASGSVSIDGSSNVTLSVTVANDSHTHAWGNITGKPTSFTPASHTHTNIVTRGDVTAESGTTYPAYSGISMQNVYNNGYPTTYGNILTLYGAGAGQLLLGWSGSSGANAPAYIRSKRDTTDAGWSSWQQLATTDGSVSYASSAGNADTLDGYHAGSFSLTSHGHSYLPLSGGTLSRHTWKSAAHIDDAVVQFNPWSIDAITSSTYYDVWFGGSHGISSQGYYNTITVGTYHTNTASRAGLFVGASWDHNNADTYFYFARDGHFIANKLVTSSNYGTSFPSSPYVGEIFFYC